MELCIYIYFRSLVCQHCKLWYHYMSELTCNKHFWQLKEFTLMWIKKKITNNVWEGRSSLQLTTTVSPCYMTELFNICITDWLQFVIVISAFDWTVHCHLSTAWLLCIHKVPVYHPKFHSNEIFMWYSSYALGTYHNFNIIHHVVPHITLLITTINITISTML